MSAQARRNLDIKKIFARDDNSSKSTEARDLREIIRESLPKPTTANDPLSGTKDTVLSPNESGSAPNEKPHGADPVAKDVRASTSGEGTVPPKAKTSITGGVPTKAAHIPSEISLDKLPRRVLYPDFLSLSKS